MLILRTLPMSILLIATFASATAHAGYFGAELRSKVSYGKAGQNMRATWRIKPATGNCSITLLSLYNGDRIFDSNQGHWSEIAFEIYGGAAFKSGANSFQTQYITYETLQDSATQRGRQHAVQHAIGSTLAGFEKVPPIWDKNFHTFQIEWLPSQDGKSYIIYRIDGQEIRRKYNGDTDRIEAGLEAYSAVWRSYQGGFGCTDSSARPYYTKATLDSFMVEVKTSGLWKKIDVDNFNAASDISQNYDLSNWGFTGFDGQYCPANALWRSNGVVDLELDTKCQ